MTQEEKALVSEVAAWTEARDALIKVLETQAAAVESLVIKFTLTDSNFNELAITKARADGARKLATDFKRYLESLNKSPK